MLMMLMMLSPGQAQRSVASSCESPGGKICFHWLSRWLEKEEILITHYNYNVFSDQRFKGWARLAQFKWSAFYDVALILFKFLLSAYFRMSGLNLTYLIVLQPKWHIYQFRQRNVFNSVLRAQKCVYTLIPIYSTIYVTLPLQHTGFCFIQQNNCDNMLPCYFVLNVNDCECVQQTLIRNTIKWMNLYIRWW